MKELSGHIGRLLLNNDCVIVPGLGGFVSYKVSARYVRNENLFLPPMRTIGFNPQLTLNDGLLVQSFMQSYDMSYPEALRMMEVKVDEVRDILENEGCYTFEDIGILHLAIDQSYSFTPNECGLLAPSLYGLGSFSISELSASAVSENEVVKTPLKQEKISPILPSENTQNVDKRKPNKSLIIRINKRAFEYTMAAAASVALFFALSTPIKNTYVEVDNYASFTSASLFNRIKNKSLVLNIVKPISSENTSNVKATAVIVPKEVSKSVTKTVPSEKKVVETVKATIPVKAVPVAPVKNEPVVSHKRVVATESVKVSSSESQSGKFKVIIASVDTRKMAEYFVQQAASKGYSGAFVVEGNGHFRVAISSHSSLSSAYNKINHLRKDSVFSDAWVLTSK